MTKTIFISGSSSRSKKSTSFKTIY